MPKIQKGTCGNCRFWLLHENQQGECRRNPPVVVNVDTEEGAGTATIFPDTAHDTWCGEHRPRAVKTWAVKPRPAEAPSAALPVALMAPSAGGAAR
jgi:hypothetical protein